MESKDFSKSMEFIDKYVQLRNELQDSIRKFDKDLNELLYNSDDNLIVCENEAKEGGNKNLFKMLEGIDKWTRVWSPLSNGVRGVLGQ